MPVSEVLQSLNTGRVDGFAQTPLYSFAAAWYRGIKFYSITKHLYQPAILVYSKKFFDKQEQSIKDVLVSDVENQTKRAEKVFDVWNRRCLRTSKTTEFRSTS